MRVRNISTTEGYFHFNVLLVCLIVCLTSDFNGVFGSTPCVGFGFGPRTYLSCVKKKKKRLHVTRNNCCLSCTAVHLDVGIKSMSILGAALVAQKKKKTTKKTKKKT